MLSILLKLCMFGFTIWNLIFWYSEYATMTDLVFRLLLEFSPVFSFSFRSSFLLCLWTLVGLLFESNDGKWLRGVRQKISFAGATLVMVRGVLFCFVKETVQFLSSTLSVFSFNVRVLYDFSQCSVKGFHSSVDGKLVACYNSKVDVVLLEEISRCHWSGLGSIVSGDVVRASEGGDDLKQAFFDGICRGGF